MRSGDGDRGPGGEPISGGGDRGPGSASNKHNTHSLGYDNENNVYWKSPEAKKLFGFFDLDYGDVDVVEGLHERMKFLKQVHQREYGYQLVIPMTEDGSLNLSSHNKFTIRNQSLFLLKAYEYALKELRVGVKWVDFCEKAVAACHKMGIETTKNGRRVADWSRHFRKADKFHHPNSHVISKFTTNSSKLKFTRRLLLFQFSNNPIILLIFQFSYNIQPTQFHIFPP